MIFFIFLLLRVIYKLAQVGLILPCFVVRKLKLDQDEQVCEDDAARSHNRAVVHEEESVWVQRDDPLQPPQQHPALVPFLLVHVIRFRADVLIHFIMSFLARVVDHLKKKTLFGAFTLWHESLRFGIENNLSE
jgi:hypothetical protein